MVTFLILTNDPVSAAWMALEDPYQTHPLQTVYIDLDTVYREGQVVEFSALIDWKIMQGGRTPTRFYSTKLTKQVDCAEKLVRTLTATDFYGHMGTGEVIGGGRNANEDKWVAIEVSSLNQGLWKTACKKQ